MNPTRILSICALVLAACGGPAPRNDDGALATDTQGLHELTSPAKLALNKKLGLHRPVRPQYCFHQIEHASKSFPAAGATIAFDASHRTVRAYAYDPAAMTQGGAHASPVTVSEWDGETWQPLAAMEGVEANGKVSMVTDERTGSQWLFNWSPTDGVVPYRLADTGATSRQGGATPAGRVEFAAYDDTRGRVLVATASDSVRTPPFWFFEGGNFVVGPQGPSPRAQSAYAFDRARGEMVQFGGFAEGAFSPNQETWVLTPAGFVQRHPAQSPPARSGAAMAFDPRIGMVVMFGGFTQSHARNGSVTRIEMNDVWLWNGAEWFNAECTDPQGRPSARVGSGIAFDDQLQQMVLFGGASSSNPQGAYSDTWVH